MKKLWILLLAGMILFTMGCSEQKTSGEGAAEVILASAYIEVLRGTPLITQLFIVFFGTAVIFDTKKLGAAHIYIGFFGGFDRCELKFGSLCRRDHSIGDPVGR